MSRSRPTIDDFIRGLRLRLPPGDLAAPPALPDGVVRQVPADADLVARFTESATAAGARVHQADRSGWGAIVTELLVAANAKRVRFEPPDEPPALAGDSAAFLKMLESREIELVQTADRMSTFSLDAGIHVADLGIAETGSVICASGQSAARATTIVPRIHIALLPRERIVADLLDAFASIDALAELPTNLVLVTGPSKTADIEGILVTGVHGPGAIHIVIF